MENGRHEEAVEGAGCDVRVARRGVSGIEVIADPCDGHFLHPGEAFVVLSGCSFDKYQCQVCMSLHKSASMFLCRLNILLCFFWLLCNSSLPKAFCPGDLARSHTFLCLDSTVTS